MNLSTQCIHCGKALIAPAEHVGKLVKCQSCRQVFVLQDPGRTVAEAEGTASASETVASSYEDTLSRSMLMHRPDLEAAGRHEEMICRLEAGTLRWLDISRPVQAFLGFTMERLRGKTLLSFLHRDDRRLAQDEFRHAVEQGERHDFILRMRSGQAQWHYMRFNTQARYAPDGTLHHIRCNLRDVTDRIHDEQELQRRTEQLTKANERLRQANQKLKEAQGQLVHSEKLAALGTLAAGMAHEINNPLAFASNNVVVLARDIAGILSFLDANEEALSKLSGLDPALKSKLDQFCAEIDLPYLRENLPRMTQSTLRGLKRVSQIVQNLRDFARLDQAEIGEIDLNESIDRGLGLLGDLLARRQIEVTRQFGTLPPLPCAPGRINQVFFNLMMNAMQAIEATGRPTGRLGIVTRSVGEVAEVEITDDGCGIPADVLPRIFDPFFTTKPVGQGTGLGLSITHGIITEHGGTIDIQSRVGTGTTVRVRLPLRPPKG